MPFGGSASIPLACAASPRQMKNEFLGSKFYTAFVYNKNAYL
jgi:hypothetical protein